jgi:putative spermidine/putrescine transport system ATP-binding protein
MSYLRLAHLSKSYGASTAVHDVSLDVAEGEMVVLLGPSGCGKTTTLRMIAGFVDASSGRVTLDGRDVLGDPPYRRNMGMVFQSYALFPHLTVARNVAFGLEMRRISRREVTARVTEMLRLVKLEPYAARLPQELSGGQQQRVALARALAIRPSLLLMDEPLSNLDATLRAEVAREIRILQRDNNLTALMVTHDQAEAMAMADRLVVMREGRVEQAGTQEDLYERPATAFVASFIGQSNSLAGTLDDDALVLDDGTALRLASRYAHRGACQLSLRPERVTLLPADSESAAARGLIELSTYLGASVEHVVRLGARSVVIRMPTLEGRATRRFSAGTAVGIGWQASAERLFGPAGQAVPPLETATDFITQYGASQHA